MALAATTYQWYLAIHILAAVIWVGGDAVTQIYAVRAMASNDASRIAGFSADIAWVGTRLFLPASLVLVIFGFLLVDEGSWSYDFWVVFGIVVWAFSALVGSLFLGPESGRIADAVEAHGADSPEVGRRIARTLMISRIELFLLILAVLDMALKPT
jgi:uncharacterized membrane protein